MKQISHADTMNRIYRAQRHFYDATRRLFLFGRDALLDSMAVEKENLVLEMGCGTARNLIRLAKKRPDIRLFGVDASREMLSTAERNIERARLSDRILVFECNAESFDRRTVLGLEEKLDRIFFSYSLSMMPDWEAALEAAFRNLAPDGALHVVDFHDQAGWPRPFRAAMRRWLALFHVAFDPRMQEALDRLYLEHGMAPAIKIMWAGYAFLANPTKAVKGRAPKSDVSTP